MKKSLHFLIVTILFSLIFLSCQKEVEEDLGPPNIIFIMTDDHAKKAVSSYSDELIQTPNIDAIANAGLQFDNAFVTNSICGPSRAVFLTGKFSHKNGFMQNSDTFDGSQATLAKYLQAAGYYTAVMGKWHLKSTPEGFNEYNVLLDQGEYYNPQFFNGTDTIIENGYATNIITDKAIEVLEKTKETKQPAFLMVHHKAPHRNWMPDTIDLAQGKEVKYKLPKTFRDTYETRSKAAGMQDMEIDNMFLGMDMKLFLKNGMDEETGTGGDPGAPSYKWWERDYNRMNEAQKAAWDKYYLPITEEYYAKNLTGLDLVEWKYQRYMNDYLKSVQSVDRNIGKILQYLKDNDMEKNTLVIYTSDQGFFLGEHGWYDKRFMYEPSLSMPLVMKFPAKIKEHKNISQLVQNVDLAPTILTAAGLDVPEEMQGKSLTTFFNGKGPGEWRDGIYYHYYQKGTWHFVQKHLGIRTDRYKLIYFYDLKEWELYDLQEDPEEVNNLYGNDEYSSITEKLKVDLAKLINEYDDDTAPEFEN